MFWGSKIQLLVKYIRFGKGELVEYINGPLAGEHMLNDLILGTVLPTIVAIFVMETGMNIVENWIRSENGGIGRYALTTEQESRLVAGWGCIALGLAATMLGCTAIASLWVFFTKGTTWIELVAVSVAVPSIVYGMLCWLCVFLCLCGPRKCWHKSKRKRESAVGDNG